MQGLSKVNLKFYLLCTCMLALPSSKMFSPLSLPLSYSNLQHNEQKPRNQRETDLLGCSLTLSFSGHKGNVIRLLLFKRKRLLLLHTSTNKTIVSICFFLFKVNGFFSSCTTLTA